MLNAKLELSIGTKKEKSLRKNQRTRGQKIHKQIYEYFMISQPGVRETA